MSVVEETNREELLANTAVKPIELAHVVFRSPNYDAMCAFYLKLLNARVAWANDMVSFMTYDHEHHRVVVINLPHLAPVNPMGAGLEHYAFTYKTLGDLLANYTRLKADGIHPCWCINHGFTTSIYYRDPDGNMIETQFENMSVPEADEFMRGEYFMKNPIGVDFDPEVLLERYRNGDAVADLIQFRSAPYAAGVEHIRPREVPPYDYNGDLI